MDCLVHVKDNPMETAEIVASIFDDLHEHQADNRAVTRSQEPIGCQSEHVQNFQRSGHKLQQYDFGLTQLPINNTNNICYTKTKSCLYG
jgi:hypothetical protein